jgi:DnaK suppressor protein
MQASTEMAQAARKTAADRGLSPDDVRAAYPKFVQTLKNRRDEIIQRQTSARANLDEQILTSPGDEADASVVDMSADYFLNMANAHQRELIEIRDALDRIDKGTYGICERNGEAISIERLEKLPYVRLCIDCQSEEEHDKLAAFPRSRPKM